MTCLPERFRELADEEREDGLLELADTEGLRLWPVMSPTPEDRVGRLDDCMP